MSSGWVVANRNESSVSGQWRRRSVSMVFPRVFIRRLVGSASFSIQQVPVHTNETLWHSHTRDYDVFKHLSNQTQTFRLHARILLDEVNVNTYCSIYLLTDLVSRDEFRAPRSPHLHRQYGFRLWPRCVFDGRLFESRGPTSQRGGHHSITVSNQTGLGGARWCLAELHYINVTNTRKCEANGPAGETRK